MKKLSKNELTALRLLQEAGGSIIEWMVPETNEKNLERVMNFEPEPISALLQAA